MTIPRPNWCSTTSCRKREHDAVDLYIQLTRNGGPLAWNNPWEKKTSWTAPSSLAEEMERAEDYAQAVFLHLRLAELEQQKPYFKHFFVEVEDRLRNLLTRKITWEIPNKQRIVIMESLLKMNFTPKNQLALIKKLVELYLEVGLLELARERFAKAHAMAPRDKALARLKTQLG
jgi:hypothetical protein